MNTYMKILSLIVISFFLIQCKEKNATYKTITINSKNIEAAVPISILFDTVEYIPLETTPTSLFKDIDKLCVDKQGNFYILDQEGTNTIYKFNSTGQFIQTIGTKGKGPQEYLTISDFIIYQDSLLDIYDGELGKHLLFDLKGNYLKEYSGIDKGDAEFIHIEDTLAYYAPCGGYAPNLSIQISNKTYSFFKQNYPEMRSKREYFHISGQRIFYTDNYNDTIFYFTKGKLEPYIYIDFKRRKLPKKLRNYNKIARSNYCYDIDDIKITPSIIYFTFTHQNRVINAFYDYTNKKSILTKAFLNDINGIPFITSSKTPNTNATFISHINASILLDAYEYNKDHNQNISTDYQQLISKLNQDSNPIIIIAHLKNNIRL